MAGDVLLSVTELTQRLRRAQATLAAAMTPARAVRDGTDETGAITIFVDDDGVARDVLVTADWRRRLSPAQVGPAVVAAHEDAAQRRTSVTAQALADAAESTLDSSSARESTEDDHPPDTRLIDGHGSSAASWLTPVSPAGPATGRPRPLAELAAAVLAAADDLERVTAPPPPAVGIGAEGAVRITLARGRITECEVSQAWLARQDETTLAHALREAIGEAARAALAAGRPFMDYQERLAAIVADARASAPDLSQGEHS